MTVVELEHVGELSAEPMLGALAAHSLARVQVTQREGQGRGSVRRLLELDGVQVPVTVRIEDAGVALELPDELDAPRADLAVGVVRRWFDLDLDPAEVHAHLGADPLLAPLLAARPGLRIVGHPDPFEAAMTTVMGQRVSLAAGRVFGTRFVDHFAAAGDLVPFPEPLLVAGARPEELRRAIGVRAAGEAEALAERWRPWRAYALFHLWTRERYVPGEDRRHGGASRVRDEVRT